MSLSSVSSALSLNERWVLLHRQPRGPRKGPTRLLLIPPLHPSDLQSSKELTARRSASVRLLHLHNLISPSLQQQQRWGGDFCLLVLSLSSCQAHPPYITLNQNDPHLYLHCIGSHPGFLSHSFLK